MTLQRGHKIITRDAQKWKPLKERIELSSSDHAATNINTMKDEEW